MKQGFTLGILTALAVSVPFQLSYYVAVIPGGLVFLAGAVFGVCIIKIAKAS